MQKQNAFFYVEALSCCLNIFFRQKDDIQKASIQFQTWGLVTDLAISDGPGNQHIHQLQFGCMFAFHAQLDINIECPRFMM